MMKSLKMLVVSNPIKTFILLAVSFALLLIGILVPLVFIERAFIENKFHGLGDGVTVLDSTTQGLISKYPTIQRTWKYGILFYCQKTEIVGDGGIHGLADSAQIAPGVNGQLGSFCNFLPFGLNVESSGFDTYYYDTAIVNNSVTIVGDMEASAIGFPGGPNGPNGPNGPSYPSGPMGGIGGHMPIYSTSGKSAFFHFANPHIFDAARVFLIIALIVTAVALIIALILAILHCSSCKVKLVHAHSGVAHLQKLLHFLLVVLLILWFIILILLVITYNHVIKGLFDNSQWSNVFAIGAIFWVLWVSYVLALAALLLTKKIHVPHNSHPPMVHEMASVETPVSYADYKYGPSMTAATPSAPPAHSHGHGASSSFV